MDIVKSLEAGFGSWAKYELKDGSSGSILRTEGQRAKGGGPPKGCIISWTCMRILDGFEMLLAPNVWYGSAPHQCHDCSISPNRASI